MKPYYARLAASLLTRAAEPELRPSAEERAAAIARIETALRDKGARQRRRRWATGVLAFAGTAAAAFAIHLGTPAEGGPAVSALVSPIGAGARVLTPTGIEPLLSGAALLPGSRLIADPTGGANVHLSTGTEIEVHPDTSMQFDEAGPIERFTLSRGDMLARVAKLHAGQRFIVSTPDAEVEVHGTVFRVAVVESDAGCAAGNQTRVEVLEGIVEVRANGTVSRVRPGERWPAACGRPKDRSKERIDAQGAEPSNPSPQATLEPSNPSPQARLEPGRARSPRRSRESASLKAQPQPSREDLSRTKVQNELFAQAVSASHAGDTGAAVSKFQALTNQYPGSPLAEGAAAERMRLLATSDPVAAQRAAREYLARYPRGFAIHDAFAILKGR